MSDDAVFRNHVRVESPDGHAATTKVTVGNMIIPVYSARIEIVVGEPTRIVLEAPADLIDVQALQENTELKLIGENDGEGKSESADSANHS